MFVAYSTSNTEAVGMYPKKAKGIKCRTFVNTPGYYAYNVLNFKLIFCI